MPTAPERKISEIVAQLGTLGVRHGDVLQVHTSFRAVRPVEDGPAGLIAALTEGVGPGGTLVMPSWTADDDRPFDPATSPAAADLGIIAGTFWQRPGVRRSAHPFAFAARGPLADSILADGLVLPPHQRNSPVGRVLDHDGKVLLLGVSHDANTTLHLAELLAGVPYRRPKHITVLKDGQPTRLDYRENDHCCEMFRLVDGWLRQSGLQTEGAVGNATARLVRARDIVDTALAHLKRDPFVFLHPDGTGCEECDDARHGTTG